MKLSKITDKPFGAVIHELAVATASIEQISRIRQLLCELELLIFPAQHDLSPAEEVRFQKRLLPEVESIWRDQKNNPWEVYKVKSGNTAGTWQLPGEPAVLVLGKGWVDHHGLRVELGGARQAYGGDKGSQVLGGGALQWHIDGAFYDHHPCRFTQMFCLEAPRSGGRWIDYNDGSGARLWAAAGATAFASGRVAWQALDRPDRDRATRLDVHYAADPFRAAQHLTNSDNGLRLIDVEAEKAFSETGCDAAGEVIDDPLAKIYPLIWGCDKTGHNALMPHSRCMHHLHESDLKKHLGVIESRLEVERLMRPAIDPQNVYVHPWQSGDLVIWNNHSVWHSATGGLAESDRRIQHLVAFNGPSPPAEPRNR